MEEIPVDSMTKIDKSALLGEQSPRRLAELRKETKGDKQRKVAPQRQDFFTRKKHSLSHSLRVMCSNLSIFLSCQRKSFLLEPRR